MVYADDMALILGTLSKTQELSTSLEIASSPCKENQIHVYQCRQKLPTCHNAR